MINIDAILSKKPFAIIGHRGARGVKPENTLVSFEYAIEKGVDIVEMDLHRTRDGEIIVFHDPDFKRLAGIDKKVSEVDLAFIKEHIRIQGEPVPTLKEVIEKVKDRAGMFLEIKDPEITSKVVEIVQENKIQNQVAIISFYDEVLIEVRKIDEQIITGLIYLKPPGRIFEAKKLGANIVLPFYRIATEKANAVAHKLDLKVAVWTVNDLETAKEMYMRKVDAIATDFPEILVAFRNELQIKD